MTSWPSGYRGALAVTVDVDGRSALTAVDPGYATRQKSLSVFEYGPRVGAPRLLELFAKHGLRATWFVPGVLGEQYPHLVAALRDAGHAVGLKGWELERFEELSREERTSVLLRARAALPPERFVGFRLPSGEWPPDFAAALLAAGFAWSSSWLGDDQPIRVRTSDGRELIDLPASFALDDRVAFGWNIDPPIPAGQSRIADYVATFDNWRRELDAATDEGLLTVLTLHAELSGGPGRAGLVDAFVRHARERGDVWIAGGDEIASWWLRHGPPQDDAHPVEVFRRLAPQHPL